MTRDCDRDDVDELLDLIADQAPDWRVDDWDFSVGAFDDAEVEVTVRWDPEVPEGSGPKSIIAAIDRHETEKGAPIEDVLAETSNRDAAEHTIDKLRQQGEVYEPNDGYLRRT